MDVERLTILAKFLETVPDDKLNMLSWRNNVAKNDVEVSDEDLIHDCNTTACAMGWACTIPEFKEAGLTYSVHGGCVVFYMKKPNSFTEVQYTAYEAAQKLFKLTDYNTTTYLFSPLRYLSVEDEREELNVDKSEVIERILKLISMNGVQDNQYQDEQSFIDWCTAKNEEKEKMYRASLNKETNHGA